MKRVDRYSSRRRHGFSLWELLLALGMFAVAGALTMRLFGASMHVIAANSLDPTSRLDQMTYLLRADVWDAKKIEMPDAKSVVITTADNQTIRWRFADQQITREEAAQSQQWTMPIAFTAERQGDALVLRSWEDQWRFTAPMLAEEAR